MKTLVQLAAIAAFALVVPLAGAAAPQDSLISAFAGPHNGTLTFVVFSGPTTGSFKTSKTKEVGTLTLVSNFNGAPLLLNLTEQLRFNKKSVTWTMNETLSDGTAMVASGVGRAAIKRNTITYKVPLSLNGITGVLSGKIKLATNNHLTILETVSGAGTSGILFYQLGGKKPKK